MSSGAALRQSHLRRGETLLDKELDMQPLPGDRVAPSFGAWTSPPRFARDLSRLVTSPGGEA